MIRLIPESHVDHGLTVAQLEYALERIGDVEGFGIHRVELPSELGTAPCGLFGPTMGDDPVSDGETLMVQRGSRDGLSRMIERSPRQVSTLTVIAGPAEGHEGVVLYTAFGGPSTPREPFDPSLDEAGRKESVAFWSEHALALDVL